MKKILYLFSAFITITTLVASPALAQTDDHTASEEAKGKIFYEKLQNKEVECADLSNEDFGALGEYFMGQMLGDAHESMNAHMTQMMGEEGEKQMHVVMGKRWSGCDDAAAFPPNSGWGFLSMMNMMGGGGMMGNWSSPFNGPNNIMMPFSYGGIWGGGGFIFMILFWLIIIGVVVIGIKYLVQSNSSKTSEKSAPEILKERYAKGEIDKKEFEEKKKDLS